MVDDRDPDRRGDPVGAGDARGERTGAHDIPPRGWEAPAADAGSPGQDELRRLLEQLLELMPDELRARLTDASRALLEAVRALLDWLLEHLERRAREPRSQVRDIPIL